MGCNGYGGSPDRGKYTIKGDGTFQLGDPFAVTVQLCTEPEGIMEQEQGFLAALTSASATADWICSTPSAATTSAAAVDRTMQFFGDDAMAVRPTPIVPQVFTLPVVESLGRAPRPAASAAAQQAPDRGAENVGASRGEGGRLHRDGW